jgi:4'-phosphopantetheinyl transferase
MSVHDGLVRIVALEDLLDRAERAGDGWLDPPERARLARLRAPRRRQQFLAGHWLMREMAAQTVGGHLEDWHLVPTAHPRLALAAAGRPTIWASVSHSGTLVAASLGSRALGLDLEIPERARNLQALAGFVLAPEEAAQLEADGGQSRIARFHAYWTLKEARGKRSGDGLLPRQAKRVMATPCAPGQADAWQWTLPGQGSLALAAWPGLSPTVQAPFPLGPATPWTFQKTL